MIRTLAALQPIYEASSIEELLMLIEARARRLPPPLPIRPGARERESSRAMAGFYNTGARAQSGDRRAMEKLKQWGNEQPGETWAHTGELLRDAERVTREATRAERDRMAKKIKVRQSGGQRSVRMMAPETRPGPGLPIRVRGRR